MKLNNLYILQYLDYYLQLVILRTFQPMSFGLLQVFHVELRSCWYSFVKLNSYESALICVKTMSYKLKWNYMDIGTFHYSQVAKSILLTVIGCWPCEYICIYIYIYIYIYISGLLQSCYVLSIELLPVLFFVCQLDASWGCWAGKCSYHCCLFCVLK